MVLCWSITNCFTRMVSCSIVSGVGELIETELEVSEVFLLKRFFNGLESFPTPSWRRGKRRMENDGDVSMVVQANQLRREGMKLSTINLEMVDCNGGFSSLVCSCKASVSSWRLSCSPELGSDFLLLNIFSSDGILGGEAG